MEHAQKQLTSGLKLAFVFGLGLGVGVAPGWLSGGVPHTFSDGEVAAAGQINANFQHLASTLEGCPQGTTNFAGWCMEDSDNAATSWPGAANACAIKGMQLCPIEAYVQCDVFGPGTTCTWTDGGTAHWATGFCGNEGSDATQQLCVYNGSNAVTGEDQSASHPYHCCRPVR